MADTAPVLIWMTGRMAFAIISTNVARVHWPKYGAGVGTGWTEGVHPDDVQGCFDGSACIPRPKPFRKEYRLQAS